MRVLQSDWLSDLTLCSEMAKFSSFVFSGFKMDN